MHSLKEIFPSKMKEVVEENNVNNDFKDQVEEDCQEEEKRRRISSKMVNDVHTVE